MYIFQKLKLLFEPGQISISSLFVSWIIEAIWFVSWRDDISWYLLSLVLFFHILILLSLEQLIIIWRLSCDMSFNIESLCPINVSKWISDVGSTFHILILLSLELDANLSLVISHKHWIPYYERLSDECPKAMFVRRNLTMILLLNHLLHVLLFVYLSVLWVTMAYIIKNHAIISVICFDILYHVSISKSTPSASNASNAFLNKS